MSSQQQPEVEPEAEPAAVVVVILRYEADDGEGSVACTYGMGHYDHPELAIISHGDEVAGEVLSDAVDLVAEGCRFDEEPCYGVADDPVYFDEEIDPVTGDEVLDALYPRGTRMLLAHIY
ncbi:hypothetical protein AUR04nite_14770 [Glutamicibacter uratoxydans]|uniref:Uncharacterized protein n=1 Tax=Glutamicibacter uratoxydans TaxID=43667 RepID=A0A4Y4DQR7_GLUUR|nr:DUF4262 domain-containing protein [Glutamicibacter uratoxydans]GED05945.1 hypothetical protein AUR04nite_14770 [Glutamicibacter uratoxydans]